MYKETNCTHVEDLEDPGKVLLPSGNFALIVHRVDGPGTRAPFTPLGDRPLDLGHGPATGASISESLGARITCLAHLFSSPIALRTDWLSSANRLPSNLR